MGKHKKKKPEIRFKGFTDDWEQRKLGDIASEMVAGGDIDRDLILEKGNYPVFANAVNGEGIVGYYDQKYRIYAPAVTVTGRGDVGHAKARLVNFTPVVRLLSIKSIHDVFFLENAVNILNIVIESTGVPQLTVPQLSKYEVRIPPEIIEEEQIGIFFKKLDHLITLHQRKLNKLKEVKKSMLEKMFPQNGEMEPQIRFCGFNSTWEQRKFEDLFAMLKNNTLSRAELSEEEGCALNVHYGDVLVQYNEILDVANSNLPMAVSSDITEKYKSSYLQDGDVVIADTAEDESVGKCCEIAGAGDNIILAGLHTMPVRPIIKFASKYLGFYLNSPSYHRQLIPLMQGTKVTSISKSSIKDTTVLHPNEYEEQNQIGEYFDKLDHLITLHQRKLEKLKKIKKALLEKMFV